MRAIILEAHGGVEHFREAEVATPAAGRGEVRIRMHAASFNPVDCQLRRAAPVAARSNILGRDLSGSIDAVGEGVDGFAVGDEVFSYVTTFASGGTYAEYVSVAAELVARKPASLAHEVAAAVPVAGITAQLALERSGVRRDRSLFIAGAAGGVGSFAIALAQGMGVERMVVTAGRAASRAHLVEHCGIPSSHIVDYHDAGFRERAIACNGGPFDVALDFAGGPMLAACCDLLAVDGHLASATDPPQPEDFETMFRKNASFHSIGAHAYSLTGSAGDRLRYRGMLQRLGRDLESGSLRAPRVQALGPLSVETVRRAHTLLETTGVQGKLVMTC